jgi:hypothetical protein
MAKSTSTSARGAALFAISSVNIGVNSSFSKNAATLLTGISRDSCPAFYSAAQRCLHFKPRVS